MHPAISILMPVRNAEAFLAECLDSILQQSEKNWELCVVDDGSSDKSYEILQAYSQKDARIKAFRQDALGIIPALRKAFEESQGTWITRMDADDLMDALKMKVLLAGAMNYGRGHLMLGRVAYFHATSLGAGYERYAAWLNALGSGEARWREIYKECVIPSPSWMIHREDLKTVGAFDPSIYPEDYDLCFRFFEAGMMPIYLEEALHHWRDHPTRSSRNDPHYSDNRFLDIKLHYFLKLSLAKNGALVLWGAGKKGKLLAKKLIEKNIDFEWVTNNREKVGKNIYEKNLAMEYSEKSNFDEKQFVIAIAGPQDQQDIKNLFEIQKMKLGKDYFFFC